MIVLTFGHYGLAIFGKMAHGAVFDQGGCIGTQMRTHEPE